MDVSIIIVTFDNNENLRQTLQALRSVHIPEGISCELLVVDNAPSQRTAEVTRSYSLPGVAVRNIHEPRGGKCSGLNAALKVARGRVMVFTDDDVRPPANWIEGISSPIWSGKAHAVAGGVRIAPHLERPWMEPEHRAWVASTELLSAEAPEYLVGANMALSREVFTKVPGFDPELGPGALGFYDDTLLGWQLQEAGYTIGSAFDVVVEHHFDESRLRRSSFLDATRKHGRSTAYVEHHWKHNAIPRPRWRLARVAGELAKMRVKGRRPGMDSEGITTREMGLMSQFHFYKHYLIERKRPRNYEKHGLVKLSGKESSE